jgi:hypothetical protein
MGTPLLQQIALKNNGVPLKKLRKLPRRIYRFEKRVHMV